MTGRGWGVVFICILLNNLAFFIVGLRCGIRGAFTKAFHYYDNEMTEAFDKINKAEKTG